ncbi:MAG: hypothetical protein L3J39_10430 [Verrucomicrobiales bacterium]|nr:hypothetical protein [Verrucomicrobiales bacterium]
MMKSLFKNELGQIVYTSWEWAIMRWVFVFVVWAATWQNHWLPSQISIASFETLRDPNGLASWFDLSFLSQPTVTAVVVYLCLALAILYVSGRLPLLATGGLFLIHAAVGSIHNSPRGHHHATQVVGLILMGQFGFFLWCSVRSRYFQKGKPVVSREDQVSHRATGAITISMQMMCAGYVVSAISKWINSGGGWIPGARWIAQVPNIIVQFSKNEAQAYYDTLQPPANQMNQWTIDFVSEHPNVAMAIFGMGFYLELLAFLSLLNRRLALLFGVSLFAMHSMISVIMRLNFVYFKMILLLFFINLPFWIYYLYQRKQKSRL